MKNFSETVPYIVKIKATRKVFYDVIKTGKMSAKFYVRLKDLEKIELPMDANPREQDLGSRVSKAIGRTLKDADEDFALISKGILIICKSVLINSENITMKFTDPEREGCVDGGHTFRKIKEIIDEGITPEQGQILIPIELCFGDRIMDSAFKIAEGRNTSVQVKDKSMYNLAGRFNPIKELVKNYPWAGEVSYKENDKMRIEVGLIIANMYAMNLTQFGKKANGLVKAHPCDSYNSFKNVVKKFVSELITNGWGPENPFYKMINIFDKLIELYEHIEKRFPAWYNAGKGSYGSFVDKEKTAKFASRVAGFTAFSKTKKDMYVGRDVIMPIYAACRILLEEDENGMYYFMYDPITFLEQAGTELTHSVLAEFKKYTDFNEAAKKSASWKAVYNDAETLFRHILKS